MEATIATTECLRCGTDLDLAEVNAGEWLCDRCRTETGDQARKCETATASALTRNPQPAGDSR